MRRHAEWFLRGFWLPAVVAGALLYVAFPNDLPFASDLGFAPATLAWAVLFASMRLRDGKKAGRQLLVAHLVFYLASIWWIAPLNFAGWIFVSFWCAAFEGVFGRVTKPLWLRTRQTGGLSWIFFAPLAHLSFDMVRTVLATGFPWHLVGYSGWRNDLLRGGASLLGVHGATLAIFVLAAALAELWVRWIEDGRLSWKIALSPAVVWAAVGVFSIPPKDSGSPTPVRFLILQANIAQKLKEDREASGTKLPDAEQWWAIHERLAAERASDADVVVWPETMLLNPVLRPDGRLDADARAFVSGGGTSAEPLVRAARAAKGRTTLAGVLTVDPEKYLRLTDMRRKWNSGIVIDPHGRVRGSQDKIHLTPFGEYIPLRFLIPMRERFDQWMRDSVGFVDDLLPGEAATPLALRLPDGGEVRAGVLICYESLFPELSADMAREGADVLVNLSNYGWYAGTSEMEQALAHAAFRAAETRRPFILASNNGISAAFDRLGRLVANSPVDKEAAFLATVEAASPEDRATTPFVLTREWTAWLLGAAGLASLLVLRKHSLREAQAMSVETS